LADANKPALGYGFDFGFMTVNLMPTLVTNILITALQTSKKQAT
jgi:hypothetical protein